MDLQTPDNHHLNLMFHRALLRQLHVDTAAKTPRWTRCGHPFPSWMGTASTTCNNPGRYCCRHWARSKGDHGVSDTWFSTYRDSRA